MSTSITHPVATHAQRPLSAVIVPTTDKEIAHLLFNLRLWDQVAFFPSIIDRPAGKKPDLVFAFSGDHSPELSEQLHQAFTATQHLKNCFSRLDIRFVGLSKALDYYHKDYTLAFSGKGSKSGPNEQFFELMEGLAQDYSGFIFYMECDCIPLRAGWLDRVINTAAGDDESWIIGSYYRGIDRLGNRFRFHLNGNALYRVGDSRFVDFLRNVWRPTLYTLIESVDSRFAYDIVLSYLFTGSDSISRNDAWKTFQEVGHRFRASALIQNISANLDNSRDDLPALIQNVLAHHPETFFLHGQVFLKLIQSHTSQDNPLSWEYIVNHTTLTPAITATSTGQAS